MTDTNIDNDTVEQAKARARAEIDAHRDQKRRQREAAARAAESAEQEIEREVRSRREHEAQQAQVRAALDRVMQDHYAKVEALRAAERAGRARGDFRLGAAAPPPARRVARLLRQRLGDDFDVFLSDLRGCDFRQFQAEVARIPADEEAERLHRERQAQAAALAEAARTMPEPEDDVETAIMDRYGFLTAVRAAELDAGAL